MSVEKKNYGRTINGELITDELIEKLVREAEDGWDVEELIRKGEAAASPPLGDKAKHPRQQH
jgi:uncharacterized membrane protein YheB (UPF0754 family)